MIVKVQRALAGSVSPDLPPVLIYDEHRKHAANVEYDNLPKWLIDALEANPKIYAHARWDKGAWRFAKLAKRQSW